MKATMKSYQRAGALGLIALFVATLSIVTPANGAGFVVAPLSALVSFACGWFWYKGRFGSDEDKTWVATNF